MKKLFLALAFLSIGIPVQAAPIFFGPTASGAANGTSCANAYAYNDGTNGINTVGKWVPGNRLVVCGIFNFTANTNLVTAQASGTNGNPITVDITGATLNSPFWPGDPVNGCSSNCGAIDTNGKQYINVVGGGTGVIQNTANGSSLANHNKTIGVYLRGDNLMLTGTTIKTLYMVTSNEGSLTCPSAGNCPGVFSVDVLVGGGSTAVEICNNVLNDAHIGIDSSSVTASFTAPPASLCTATQASSGINLYNNTINDHGWQIHVGGNGHVNIFNNDMTNWTPWFNPSGALAYHLDGVIAFPGAAGVVHPHIWNNYIHGDFSNSSPTGFIFCTYGVAASGSACDIFNNLLVGTGNTATAAQGIYFHSADGNPLGPHTIYNNTLIGFSTGQIYTDGDSTQHYTVKNNIFQSNLGFYITLNGTPTANFTSDNNLFFGARNVCGPPCGFPAGRTLAQWQALGEDTHSKEQNPLLAANFFLQSGSPAIGLGANLTSVGTLALDTGAPQTPGAAYSCGSGCIPRPSGVTAWDDGPFPFASGVSVPATPTGLTATVSGSTVVLLWNPSTGTPAGYFVNRNGVQIANVTSGNTFSDTGLANGTYSYTVAAYNSAGTSANSTPASATVSTACALSYNPPSLAFGTVTQGSPSPTQSVTITNVGTASCTSVSVANPSNADFGQTNSCSATLAVNASCAPVITFTPSGTTSELSALVVTSNDPASPSSVPLSGTGSPAVVLNPAVITLANTYTTHTSATAVLTYSNQSGASITVSSIVFSTGDSAMFSENDNCVGAVANGSSCTINITFTPTSNGNKTTNLVITDSAIGSPRTVVVTGRASGHGIIRIGVAI